MPLTGPVVVRMLTLNDHAVASLFYRVWQVTAKFLCAAQERDFL